MLRTRSIEKNRIDADLLVKIEVRRKIDAPEEITDAEKQLDVVYHVSPEMQDIDSFAICCIKT